MHFQNIDNQYRYSQKITPNSTGKELDAETGYSYFGARYLDHTLTTAWLSVDPMSDKYPSISPYAYCEWNPVKLVDSEGMEDSPIYDREGNFLGTDDKGLKGSAIFMDKTFFIQGMNHETALALDIGIKSLLNKDAVNKFKKHFSGLKYRPDYDGFVTISEGIQWAKDHPDALTHSTPDNTLYINAALLDLGFLTVKNSGLQKGEDFRNVNLYDFVNRKSIRSIYTTYALGNTSMKLIDNNGTVVFNGDKYDWDYHDESPLRNLLISFERIRAGIDENHGFKICIYGKKQIEQEWPF